MDEVKTFESMEDLRRSDERKAHVAKVESSRSEINLVTRDARARRAELEGYVERRNVRGGRV